MRSKTKYIIIHEFQSVDAEDRKEKINMAIRNLCLWDIENEPRIGYNNRGVKLLSPETEQKSC